MGIIDKLILKKIYKINENTICLRSK